MAHELNLLLLCFVVRGKALINWELILKNSAFCSKMISIEV